MCLVKFGSLRALNESSGARNCLYYGLYHIHRLEQKKFPWGDDIMIDGEYQMNSFTGRFRSAMISL